MTASMKHTPLPADRPVRMGLVGLGSAAQLLHLPVLTETDSVELVGLCDVESYKVSMVSEKLGVDGFIHVDNLIEKKKPDVLLICTPTISHLPIALAAMQAGIHVIIEKPVARDVNETRRLIEAARKNSVLALVAMNQRFRQETGILRKYLEAKKLGDIWRMRTGWLKQIERWNHSPWLDERNISGGGVLLDLGVQLIDVVLWLLQYPSVRRVTGYTHNVVLGQDVEDTVTAVVEFTDNATFYLDCSWALRAKRDISYTHVDGTSASASLPGLTLTHVGEEGLEESSPAEKTDPQGAYIYSLRTQMQQFVKMLRGQVPPMSTVDEALKVMELIDLIYRSAAEGREIQLDPS